MPKAAGQVFALWIALAGAALAGCSEATPRVESVKPRVTAIDWRGATVEFDVRVKNPLPVDLSAPGGRYAVDIGETELFSSDAFPAASLPRRDSGTIVLPARFEYDDLLALVQDASSVVEIPYGLRGALVFKVAGQSLEAPFKHRGKIPVLHMPEVEVTDIKDGSVGFAGVDVTVSAVLINPNAFEIGTGDISFALTIAGSRIAEVKVRTPGRIRSRSEGGIVLEARVSGAEALSGILGSRDFGQVRINLTGSLETPFGKVPLSRE